MTANDALGKEFQIKGFPTIKYFSKGKPSEYGGGRTEKDIVGWIKKKIGPSFKTVNTDTELSAMQDTADVIVLGAFTAEDSPNALAFKSLADDYEGDSLYAFSTASSVLDKLSIKSDTVVVLKSFDEGRADLAIEAFDEKAVSEFIGGESSPLVQTFSQESSRKIFSSPISKHALVFTDTKAAHHAGVITAITESAKTYKGKAMFVNVPSNAENKRVLDYFDIKDSDLPKMILADMNPEGGQMKKYFYEGAFESAAITPFVADVLDGKMTPSLKSEEPSAEDTAGPVTILKGKSFNELVVDNTKDVFVEFYAPWCGHCKQLAPTWDSLGEKFAAVDDVVIAKMDATANEIDVPGLGVKGFPTLFFLKGNDKAHPIKYEGGRSLDDLVSYVKEKASNKFSHDEL